MRPRVKTRGFLYRNNICLESWNIMENTSKTRKHWLVFGAVSLMYMASIGLVSNTIGVYYAPVSKSLNILTGTFAMNATLAAITTAIGALFTPQVVNKIGIKKTFILGALLNSFGIFSMGLTESVLVFNILGMARGIGVAFAFVPGIATLNNWFKEKNGLVISLAAAGSGVISVIMSPIFIKLIELIGWQYTFFVNGAVILLLSLPAILLPFTYEPREEGLFPYGANDKEKSEQTASSQKMSSPVQTKDFLGSTFYAFITLAFFQTFVVGFGQHLPGYGTSLNLPAEVTGLMLSAMMLGNVSIKLLSGFLSDKIGVVKTTIFAASANSISILLLVFLNSEIGLLFAALLFGTAYSGGVLHSLLSQHFFGVRVGNYVNSFVVFAASGAAAIGNVAIGYFYDFFGSYIPIFWLMIGLQLISLVFLLIAEKSRVKYQKQVLVREKI